MLQIAHTDGHWLGLSGATRGKEEIGDAFRTTGRGTDCSGGKTGLRLLTVQHLGACLRQYGLPPDRGQGGGTGEGRAVRQ